MHMKLIALAGVVLSLAACETMPEDAGDASGGGAAMDMDMPMDDAMPADDGAMAEPLTPREMLVDAGDRVFFEFDRYDIREDGQATLMRQAALLRNNPDLTVIVSGHCDERGTRDYNLALGDRRATAAKNFLVQAGVDGARISTISYGKDRPIVIGHTKSAWAQNRVAVTSFHTKN